MFAKKIKIFLRKYLFFDVNKNIKKLILNVYKYYRTN